MREDIAGDTGATKEAKQVRCDIALVPVGGTYTMDVKRAAELVNIIRPEYAIPTHYGSIVGKKTDGKAFAELVSSPVKVIEKIQYFE
ncbi:MBL fold metallo-hydrolase [Butyrivibrio sp. XPD2002]|uniref:MBL fold metallo-hydrolase n=1 Tax=Butyrivibrio sp. XPD2002 TaxID=1280665 RepID=UPI0009DB7499|nr:MBL fold metallo-hydrolase [Butyrivibrio sp. XPD2002]